MQPRSVISQLYTTVDLGLAAKRRHIVHELLSGGVDMRHSAINRLLIHLELGGMLNDPICTCSDCLICSCIYLCIECDLVDLQDSSSSASVCDIVLESPSLLNLA